MEESEADELPEILSLKGASDGPSPKRSKAAESNASGCYEHGEHSAEQANAAGLLGTRASCEHPHGLCLQTTQTPETRPHC